MKSPLKMEQMEANRSKGPRDSARQALPDQGNVAAQTSACLQLFLGKASTS